jgi:hypothetical protein
MIRLRLEQRAVTNARVAVPLVDVNPCRPVPPPRPAASYRSPRRTCTPQLFEPIKKLFPEPVATVITLTEQPFK